MKRIIIVVLSTLGVVAGLVFLLLASFVAEARKDKCILQMSTVQRLVMSHANLKELKTGDAVTMDDLVPERLKEAPKCPSGGTYTIRGKVPDEMTVYYQCNKRGHDLILN